MRFSSNPVCISLLHLPRHQLLCTPCQGPEHCHLVRQFRRGALYQKGCALSQISAPLSYLCDSRGTAKSFDHCTLVHALWKTFAELNVGVWLERIPTKENIADDPSRSHSILCICHKNISHTCCLCIFREDYRILHRLGATQVQPRLFDVFLESQTWAQLSIARSGAFKRRYSLRW